MFTTWDSISPMWQPQHFGAPIRLISKPGSTSTVVRKGLYLAACAGDFSLSSKRADRRMLGESRCGRMPAQPRSDRENPGDPLDGIGLALGAGFRLVSRLPVSKNKCERFKMLSDQRH
jgi:hypothetical protein